MTFSCSQVAHRYKELLSIEGSITHDEFLVFYIYAQLTTDRSYELG